MAVGVALEGRSLLMKGRSQFIRSSSSMSTMTCSIIFVDKAAILYHVSTSMGPILVCFSATHPQDGDAVSLHTGLVRDQFVLVCFVFLATPLPLSGGPGCGQAPVPAASSRQYSCDI